MIKGMKIKKHPNKKITILAVIIFAAVLASSSYFLYARQTQLKEQPPSGDESRQKIDYSPPTENQKNAGASQKQEIIDKDQTTQPRPSNLTVTITAANQNGSVVNIRSLIQAVVDTGNCTLSLTKAESAVTKQSSIQPLASNSTCKGFDIPRSELSSGTWHLKITVTSGNASGSAEKDIDIN
jgi:hypothetical protein